MPLMPEHQELLAPLFEVLPLETAMPALLPAHAAPEPALRAAGSLVAGPLAGKPHAQSALWLYVDALDRSHTISQGLHDATGSYLHGIMHRREGDFWNSHYWMRQAGSHPVWTRVEGYDPGAFIDKVQQAKGQNPQQLVDMQRAEWVEVMTYCLVEL